MAASVCLIGAMRAACNSAVRLAYIVTPRRASSTDDSAPPSPATSKAASAATMASLDKFHALQLVPITAGSPVLFTKSRARALMAGNVAQLLAVYPWMASKSQSIVIPQFDSAANEVALAPRQLQQKRHPSRSNALRGVAASDKRTFSPLHLRIGDRLYKRVIESPSHGEALQLDSVKRKRKKMMNKHKYRKRLKKERYSSRKNTA